MRRATSRSSFESSRSAPGWNSILQPKAARDFLQRDPGQLLLQPLQRKVVVLQVLQVLQEGLPDVVALAAARGTGKPLQPPLKVSG